MKRKDILSLKIKRFIERGRFSEDVGTVSQLLEEAGNLLDDSESHEIIGGGVLFQCSDGKWYTASTEVVVNEANPEWVKDELKRAKKS